MLERPFKMTNSIDKIRSEKRRLTILRLLKSECDYSMSTLDLQDSLALFGYGTSFSKITSDVDFLLQSNLITSARTGRIVVICLNQNGIDCANGLFRIDGVARPSPELLEAIDIITDSLSDEE